MWQAYISHPLIHSFIDLLIVYPSPIDQKKFFSKKNTRKLNLVLDCLFFSNCYPTVNPTKNTQPLYLKQLLLVKINFPIEFNLACVLQLTWALHATLKWSWLSVSKWFHVERMRWKLRKFPRRRWHVKKWNPGNKPCIWSCKIKFWNLERNWFVVFSL